MKKSYRLAFDWLNKWHTALIQADMKTAGNDMLAFWTTVSRDLGMIPEGLTDAETVLYKGLQQANFTYLEHIFIQADARIQPQERGEDKYILLISLATEVTCKVKKIYPN